MSTPKKPAKKKAPKTIAPMPKSRLDAMNKNRKKEGKPPLDPSGKEIVAVKPEPAPKILASPRSIQDITNEKIKFHKGGIMEIVGELEPSEGVSLISFYRDQERYSALYIGTTLAHLTKKDRVTIEAIAEATGLDIKTLRNYATTMRGISKQVLAKAQRAAEKAGHEITMTHLAKVATLTAPQQEKLLMKAAEEGSSVSELGTEAKKLTPESPKVKAAAKKKAKAAKAAAEQLHEQARNAPETPVEAPEDPQGIIVLNTPLAPDLIEANDRHYGHADEIGDYLHGANFKILKTKDKKDWLDVLKPLHAAYEQLLNELTESAA